MTSPAFADASAARRAARRLVATAPASWVLSRVAHRVDGAVLHATRGRHCLASLLTGLPVVVLTTTGRRSGLPRSVPLLGVPTEGGIAVIASSWGSRSHPAWFTNLRADPSVTVTVRGRSFPATAHVLTGAERSRVWRQGLALYPGWAGYDRRAGDRELPVVLLRPGLPHGAVKQ